MPRPAPRLVGAAMSLTVAVQMDPLETISIPATRPLR